MAKKTQQAAAHPRASYGKIVGPYWDDKPVAIVGGGTSLKDFDFERLRGAHVLAVKGSIFSIPWADAGFGLDYPRYVEWKAKIAALQMRVYWAVPWDKLDEMADGSGDNVTFLNRLEGGGVDESAGAIYGGGTSGYGAMQVAIHKRGKQIVLFGFDYEGPYGSREQVGAFRHNEQFYDRKRAQSAENWYQWAANFAGYVPYLNQHGISVINACPQSAITAFQKVTLDDGVDLVTRGVE